MKRLARICRKLASCDFADLTHSAWLRWRGLEFGGGQYVSPDNGNPHAHSGGPKLAKVLKCLDIPPDSVALDYGVGMGIAAITMSRFFSRVIGVDLSQELIDIAHHNVRKVGVKNVELYCEDARSFRIDPAVTHVYMFNPFLASVMRVVMANVKLSLSNGHPVTVIYKYPECDECDSCREIIKGHGFAHYHTLRPKNSHPFDIYVGK